MPGLFSIVHQIYQEILESGCKSTGGTTSWEQETLEEDGS